MLRHFVWSAICLGLLGSSGFGLAAPKLKINGSSTVNPVVVEAAELLRKKGWEILVDTQGGSSGGISHAAEGLADIGMASRPLIAKDHKKFPKAELKTFTIGYDAVALVVAKKLYDSGVKSLSRQQMQDLYEGKTKNWHYLGGPELMVVFYNKEPGRGTWETFANFVYGKSSKAPKVFLPEVGSNQEAKAKVLQRPGGVTQLSAAWAYESSDLEPLAIAIAPGKAITPSEDNIRAGTYPMKRPLNLVTNGEPNKEQQAFIDFLLSNEGQEIVKRHGYVTIDQKTGA